MLGVQGLRNYEQTSTCCLCAQLLTSINDDAKSVQQILKPTQTLLAPSHQKDRHDRSGVTCYMTLMVVLTGICRVRRKLGNGAPESYARRTKLDMQGDQIQTRARQLADRSRAIRLHHATLSKSTSNVNPALARTSIKHSIRLAGAAVGKAGWHNAITCNSPEHPARHIRTSVGPFW